MLSLRDAAFALRGDPVDGGWSLQTAVALPAWPPLPTAPASTRAVCQRFSSPGAELRALAADTVNQWSKMDRGRMVGEIRDRLRDPALVSQGSTSLCGPTAIVFELARRTPTRYVKVVRDLLRTGFIAVAGDEDDIEAEEDLRRRPAPGPMAHVDWMLTATMRDDANLTDDVDDGGDIEGYTLWGGMRDWTRDVLKMPNHGWETCLMSGESDVMLKLRKALVNGGVAFMLIDSCLLNNGESDDEEEMWRRRAKHTADEGKRPFGEWHHSEDDRWPPDHWVALIDGLAIGSDPGDEDPVNLTVWSWAAEYEIKGTVEALGEYLYAGVWGYP